MTETLTETGWPIAPPADWFDTPEVDGPMPLTFMDDGRVMGHLAIWGSCHVGFLNGALSECVKPPRSETNYEKFHLAPLRTAEGSDVTIGKLTYDTGHAPLTAGMAAATRHYDHTGSVGAFVRARDGKHGIWLSGAVRSDLTPEGFRDIRANPPSGDWRSYNHNLELIASLAVVVPGFPVVQPQFALAASGAGEAEVCALILPGYVEDVETDHDEQIQHVIRGGAEYVRRRAVLADASRR